MKEDYLWDKTGQDVEIERLENALKAFRFQETEPPALPAKIISYEKKSLWRFFSLSFAPAGFAALMIVCLGVWFVLFNQKPEIARDSGEAQKTETAKNSIEMVAPSIDEKVSSEVPIKNKADLTIEKAKFVKQPIKLNISQTRKIVLAAPRQSSLVARHVEAKKPEVKLTKQEKYAYDQLMLALSITGSKLKLVTDKIDKVEEKNIVGENNR